MSEKLLKVIAYLYVTSIQKASSSRSLLSKTLQVESQRNMMAFVWLAKHW